MQKIFHTLMTFNFILSCDEKHLDWPIKWYIYINNDLIWEAFKIANFVCNTAILVFLFIYVLKRFISCENTYFFKILQWIRLKLAKRYLTTAATLWVCKFLMPFQEIWKTNDRSVSNKWKLRLWLFLKLVSLKPNLDMSGLQYHDLGWSIDLIFSKEMVPMGNEWSARLHAYVNLIVLKKIVLNESKL